MTNTIKVVRVNGIYRVCEMISIASGTYTYLCRHITTDADAAQAVATFLAFA